MPLGLLTHESLQYEQLFGDNREMLRLLTIADFSGNYESDYIPQTFRQSWKVLPVYEQVADSVQVNKWLQAILL
jgi:hypothetical protein